MKFSVQYATHHHTVLSSISSCPGCCQVEAVAAIVGHLPKLVLLLNSPQDMSQPMPYGLLIPPLGRTRLKVRGQGGCLAQSLSLSLS